MRCLIVDAEAGYVRALAPALACGSIEWDVCHGHAAALRALEASNYMVMVVSLNSPGVDGVSLLREARSEGWKLPIIMLSQEGQSHRNVAAFEAGADDCITPNMEPSEVVARLYNVFRRAHDLDMTVIEVSGLAIDLKLKRVEYRGKEVCLRRKEYQVLEALALRKGRQVSRDFIQEQLYGPSVERDPKIIDVYVSQLRRKLRESGLPAGLIRTVYMEGFILVDQDEALQAA